MTEKMNVANEVKEGVEEAAEACNNLETLKKVGKGAVIGTVTVAATYFGYKKVVKPGVAKFKTWIASKKAAKESADQEVTE